MKNSVSCVILFICFICVCIQADTVLFTENWDSNTINPAVWTNTDSVDIVIEQHDPLDPCDLALALKGYQDGTPAPAPAWGDHIRSVATWNRKAGSSGEVLYMQYNVWYKAGVNAQAGVHGGWHWDNIGHIYNTIEAAVDYLFSDFRASEAIPYVNGIQSGPSMSNFNSAWGGANTKAGALLVRITLDPNQGAKWAFSTDNGDTWTVDRDNMGTGDSDTEDNYIGFGPFHNQAGTTFVDDIEVGLLSPYKIEIDPGDGVAVDEEGPTSDTYTITIVGGHTATVTVTADPDNQLQVNSGGQGNPVNIDFPVGTASQVVQVTAIDDSLNEANHTGTITHTSSSTDLDFNDLTISDLVVNITDNELFCGQVDQVYSVFDVSGPEGVPDCYVNLYDLGAFGIMWLGCTDLSDPTCNWTPTY